MNIHPTLLRFIKFGLVGTFGFCVDYGVLMLGMRLLRLDPYSAAIISYIAAATVTWIGNRQFTFGDRPKEDAKKQWVAFLIANGFGLLINRGTYFGLVALVPFVHHHLILGVAAGSIAGMVFNFVASSRFIFKPA